MKSVQVMEAKTSVMQAKELLRNRKAYLRTLERAERRVKRSPHAHYVDVLDATDKTIDAMIRVRSAQILLARKNKVLKEVRSKKVNATV